MAQAVGVTRTKRVSVSVWEQRGLLLDAVLFEKKYKGMTLINILTQIVDLCIK